MSSAENVLFAVDLVHSLVEARDQRELGRLRRRLAAVDLLILDGFGFVPCERAGGGLLFNLVVERYERRAIVLTTNLSFAKWPRVLGGDEKLATALIDRLAHHATVITTKGKSYACASASTSRQRGARRSVEAVAGGVCHSSTRSLELPGPIWQGSHLPG